MMNNEMKKKSTMAISMYINKYQVVIFVLKGPFTYLGNFRVN